MAGRFRKITFKNGTTLTLLSEVPDTIYQLILTTYSPDRTTPSPDILFALRTLLTDTKMIDIWKKLKLACIRAQKKYPETSQNQFIQVIFSLITEIYRKQNSTRPLTPPGYQDSKERNKIKNRSKALFDILSDYPHSDELYSGNPELSQIRLLLSHLIFAIESFKPKGRERNALFGEANTSRKSHGFEGRQRYFIHQVSHGFNTFLGAPLDHVVAELADLLFPDLKTHPTAENVRKMNTKVQKINQNRQK